jgi:hypothetical protein
MKLQEIHESVLAECVYDDVGLWSIIVRVHGESYAWHSTLPDPVRQETIQIVNDLLSEELIEVGNPNGPEFVRFSWSVPELIDYIESEWNKLGRTPDVGEICWFRATPKGKKLANELGLAGY